MVYRNFGLCNAVCPLANKKMYSLKMRLAATQKGGDYDDVL